MVKRLLPSIILLMFATLTFTQDQMRVVRTKSVDRSLPISNVFVDRENKRWAANTEGIFQVFNIQNGAKQDAISGQVNILSFPDGNHNLLLSESALINLLGESTIVTTARYDDKLKELWVGTETKGVFQIKTEPEIQLLSHLTVDNSKLLSNHIHSVFIDRKGEKWIGTEDGALVGVSGSWEHLHRFFNIYAFTQIKDEIWVSTDDLIWWVNDKGKWTALELDQDMYEGPIIDLEFDSKGQLWLASEILTHFNISVDSFKTYGPIEYFTSQFVNRIAVDQDDAIWIATEDKGLYQIEREDAINVTIHLDNALSCDGSVNDAQLRAEVVGGEPPYSFEWNDDLQGDQLSGLAAGMYVLTITDSGGRSKVTEYEIPDPVVNLEITVDQPADEEGQNGKATLAISGGVPEYQIRWDNGESERSAVNLSNGVHSVIVTDEAGCTAEISVDIPQKFLPLSIYIEVIRENTCHGEENAVINYHANGGKKPYSSEWSNGTKMDEASGLGAGSYSVTLTDAEGNAATASVEISEPDPLEASINVISSATANASDGHAQVNVQGGTAPYSGQWEHGPQGMTLENLPAGDYTIMVTDANGCETSASIVMTEDILPLTISMIESVDPKCFGSNDGSAKLIVTGGKSPYQYEWNKPGLEGIELKALSKGNYTLTVTDVTGSTALFDIEMKVPEQLIVNIETRELASEGNQDGKATAVATGGTGKYKIEWDSGENGSNAKRLSQGLHQVTVTDEAGCINVASFEMSKEILPLTVDLVVDGEVLCYGQKASGSIRAEVNGGMQPYTYNWGDNVAGNESILDFTAGSYSITVKDALNTTAVANVDIGSPEPIQVQVDMTAPASTDQRDGKAIARATGGIGKYTFEWDTGEKSKTASNLGAGAHILIVTDENGCTGSSEVVISEDILPLSVVLESTNEISCADGADGSIQSIVKGGKGPFSYEWGNASLKGADESNLVAGTYSLTITDAVGSTAASQISLSEPDQVEIILEVIASATTNQSDGKASATVTGGTGKYTYLWNNGEASRSVTSLAPGTYSLTVTDENGCSATGELEMTEDILPLSIDIEITQEIQCTGNENGTLSSVVKGGKGPFQYFWTNDNGDQVTGSNLGSGTYTLLVKDVAGNTATDQIALPEPDELVVEVILDAPASTNESNGKATAKVTGGTGKHSIEWENGENQFSATGLAPGLRTLTITDENGCSASATIEIPENILPLAVDLNGTTMVDCYADETATLEAVVRGGKGPFTYQWNNGQTSEKLSDLGSGTYSVQVSDATGNQVSAEFVIQEPKELILAVEVISPANTDETDGKAKAIVQGGTGDYQYEWDHGESSIQANQLAPGMHTLTVTDQVGCSTITTFEITEEILPLTASIELASAITCPGAQDGAVRATISGGKKPYTLSWQENNSSDPVLNNLGESAVQLNVTDAVGQETQATFDLKAPEQLVANITSKKPTRTERTTDGKATVSISGGTAPYTFSWSSGENTATAKDLPFGLSSVTVTDANGCTASTDVDIVNKILPDLTAGMLKSGQTIKIEKLQFEADSSVIMDSSLPVLNEIYEFLEDNPFIVVEIGGHTNGLPSHEFCDRLSSARAKMVADFITGRGINSKRVIFKGYGKRQPIATNQTPEGRRRNQRVEVKILEIEESDAE